MKGKLSILIFFVGLGSSISPTLAAQHIRSYDCKDEQVHPNLKMTIAAEVSGLVCDQTGATFSQIILQIRDPYNSKVLRSASVDERGAFHFGLVPRGEFRLVPAKVLKNATTRVPGFDPPTALLCSGEHTCELRVVLAARSTDLPYTSCPPK